jgi:hypothetical protein
MLRTISVGGALLATAGLAAPLAADRELQGQAAIVAAELETIAQHLHLHPEMAIDLTDVSGEYCLNTWRAGGAQMVHFAVDPTATTEDVVEFVEADSLTSHGVDVRGLPPMPAELGAMTPGQWYYLAAGEPEPHHGDSFPFPLLVRASDLR